jgi:hypothetical protein
LDGEKNEENPWEQSRKLLNRTSVNNTLMIKSDTCTIQQKPAQKRLDSKNFAAESNPCDNYLKSVSMGLRVRIYGCIYSSVGRRIGSI